MPTLDEIITFDDPPPPEGMSPWVPNPGPNWSVAIVDADPEWPAWYRELADRVREALGARVLQVQHVGSTSVPGLPAKPIIDIDLTVADPDDEDAYVPALEAAGFEQRVREPWWHGHRMLRAPEPACHLHVFGPDSPEQWKHRIFRDWLRGNADDRHRYAAMKREASAASKAAGEHMMQYNARKEDVVREIYGRAFKAAGLM